MHGYYGGIVINTNGEIFDGYRLKSTTVETTWMLEVRVTLFRIQDYIDIIRRLISSFLSDPSHKQNTSSQLFLILSLRRTLIIFSDIQSVTYNQSQLLA